MDSYPVDVCALVHSSYKTNRSSLVSLCRPFYALATIKVALIYLALAAVIGVVTATVTATYHPNPMIVLPALISAATTIIIPGCWLEDSPYILPCFVAWCASWLSIVHTISLVEFTGVPIYLALLRPTTIILSAEYVFLFFVTRRNIELGAFGSFHMAVQDLLIGGVVALKMVLNALLELAGAVEKWLWVSRAVVSGKQQDGYEASLQPPPYTT